MKLSSIILENRFDQQARKLEGELRDTFNNDDIHVSMGYYAEDGPKASKGYGSIMYRQKEEVDPSEWKSLKNTLQAKGFSIESDANYFDDDGDRYYYPKIKFEFDI
jgi:hypothetical protein|tara:strand:+ start:12 stop:329 length:318 start_codon:yes stop_codon:yes gene_type:complete